MRGAASGPSAVMTGPGGGTNTATVDTYTTGSRPRATAPPTTLRVPATFVSTRSDGGPATPTAAAAWTAASQPSSAAATEAASSMSPGTSSTRSAGTSSAARTSAARPGSRTSARGRWPAASSAAMVWEPTNPDAPVTRTRILKT